MNLSERTTALKRCVSHTLLDVFSQWLRLICASVLACQCVCVQIVLTTARGISTLRRFLHPNCRLEHGSVLEVSHGNIISIRAWAPSSALRCCRRLWRTWTHIVLQQCDAKDFSPFFFHVCCFVFLLMRFPFASCVVIKTPVAVE